MKKCPNCGLDKPLSEFYKIKEKRGYTSWCKQCLRERKIKTYHSSSKGLEAVRKHSYKNLYGLTIEQYNDMFIKQSGGCAICGNPPIKGKVLDIDHCHKTGKIRGLLCHRCNMAIGMANDNTNILRLAIKYIDSYK